MIDPSVRHVGAAAPVRPSLSLELFPPRPGPYASQTWGALDRLLAAGPDFASVTYRPTFVTTTGGAPPAASPGGSAGGDDGRRLTGAPTRVHVVREHNPSEDVVAHVLARSDVPLMTHLTCIGYKKANVVEIVRLFLSMGVRRFLALRGDPPVGAPDYVPHPQGYAYAADLVEGLRRVAPFEISVAAYPETHPSARSAEADLDNLKRKIDAGANRAITQFFFDPDTFFRFRDACAAAGTDAPIIPGILPIQSWAGAKRFAARCGTTVPQWAEDAFAAAGRDGERALAVLPEEVERARAAAAV